MLALARAAATFMASVIARAPASRAPRNTPGKASTLLIWFGSSLRPVATTAAERRSPAGSTSGSGLARANTIASWFIARRSAGWSRSEERRVGKECRSRWAAEHENKKMRRASSDRVMLARKILHLDHEELWSLL